VFTIHKKKLFFGQINSNNKLKISLKMLNSNITLFPNQYSSSSASSSSTSKSSEPIDIIFQDSPDADNLMQILLFVIKKNSSSDKSIMDKKINPVYVVLTGYSGAIGIPPFGISSKYDKFGDFMEKKISPVLPQSWEKDLNWQIPGGPHFGEAVRQDSVLIQNLSALRILCFIKESLCLDSLEEVSNYVKIIDGNISSSDIINKFHGDFVGRIKGENPDFDHSNSIRLFSERQLLNPLSHRFNVMDYFFFNDEGEVSDKNYYDSKKNFFFNDKFFNENCFEENNGVFLYNPKKDLNLKGRRELIREHLEEKIKHIFNGSFGLIDNMEYLLQFLKGNHKIRLHSLSPVTGLYLFINKYSEELIKKKEVELICQWASYNRADNLLGEQFNIVSDRFSFYHLFHSLKKCRNFKITIIPTQIAKPGKTDSENPNNKVVSDTKGLFLKYNGSNPLGKIYKLWNDVKALPQPIFDILDIWLSYYDSEGYFHLENKYLSINKKDEDNIFDFCCSIDDGDDKDKLKVSCIRHDDSYKMNTTDNGTSPRVNDDLGKILSSYDTFYNKKSLQSQKSSKRCAHCENLSNIHLNC